MHLTRPKSSKGRSRTAVNSSLYAADGIQRPHASPESPVHHSRPDRTLRSQSQPIMSQGDVLQMLQHAPAAPSLSLNKYKVLPSIERRQSEVSAGRRSLDKSMSKLHLSDDALLQRHEESHDPPSVKALTSFEMDLKIWPKPPQAGPSTSKEAGEAGSLLLAVRAPCGRRFQQHFHPTDTLLTVRASAEVKHGAKYGDASIETMDVPRRTFTDMGLTLAQCGILNRSVLCISQHDSDGEA